MKKLLSILTAILFAACAVRLCAVTATVTTSFDANANPAATEFFVEQKVGAGFVEVAKGLSSPLTFTLPNVPPGTTVTVRVKARLPGVPGSDSAASPEASAIVPLNAPKTVGVVIVVP